MDFALSLQKDGLEEADAASRFLGQYVRTSECLLIGLIVNEIGMHGMLSLLQQQYLQPLASRSDSV